MNCPDIDMLLSEPEVWSEHLDRCSRCATILSASRSVMDALAPPLEVDPALTTRTARTVRRVAEADRQRSVAGVIATFALAMFTLGPIALSAYAAAGGDASRLAATGVCVILGAAVVTALEPRVFEG
jgi:predicted phage tail protein